MLTQCPHCLTLFRVKPEQLEVAAGKVRCCQCNHVFNALSRLQDSAVDLLHQQTAGFDKDTLPFANTIESTQPTEDLKAEEETSELTHFILEKDDGLESEPDYLTADSDPQISILLDQNSTPTPLPEERSPDEPQAHAQPHDLKPKDSTTESPKAPHAWKRFGNSILKDDELDTTGEQPVYDTPSSLQSTDKPASLPSGQWDDERTYDFQPTDDDEKSNTNRLPWIIGSLLLLLLLSGQLAWQWRERLIQHDTSRQLLESFCRIAGCDLPILRDTSKILIQGRNLGTHPNKPHLLFMQLSMINTADFEQPYPKLQLTVYNDAGKLIARRTFTPVEYLPYGIAENALMPKARPVLAEMELADPGKEVTGFTFDFL